MVNVDVDESVLGRQGARDVLRIEPATLDEDFAEALPGARLLRKRLVELLVSQKLALQEHRSQMRPCIVA